MTHRHYAADIRPPCYISNLMPKAPHESNLLNEWVVGDLGWSTVSLKLTRTHLSLLINGTQCDLVLGYSELLLRGQAEPLLLSETSPGTRTRAGGRMNRRAGSRVEDHMPRLSDLREESAEVCPLVGAQRHGVTGTKCEDGVQLLADGRLLPAQPGHVDVGDLLAVGQLRCEVGVHGVHAFLEGGEAGRLDVEPCYAFVELDGMLELGVIRLGEAGLAVGDTHVVAMGRRRDGRGERALRVSVDVMLWSSPENSHLYTDGECEKRE